MKKVIILAALFLVSCNKEKTKKCACDKITKIESGAWYYGNRSIVGNEVWYQTIYHMTYYTTNECSGQKLKQEKEVSENDLGKMQKVNACFDVEGKY